MLYCPHLLPQFGELAGQGINLGAAKHELSQRSRCSQSHGVWLARPSQLRQCLHCLAAGGGKLSHGVLYHGCPCCFNLGSEVWII